MMAHPVSDSDPVFQEFRTWFHDSCKPGLLDPTHWNPKSNIHTPMFLPQSSLQEYLLPNNFLKLRRLLRGLRIINFNTIAQKYLRVCCILLLIGKSEYIERFAEQDHLQDSHLPFYDKPANFPTCSYDGDSKSLFELFREQQWILCAPTIHYQVGRVLLADLILPISIIRRLGKGVSATLFEVEIHSGYNELYSSGVGIIPMPNDRSANTFVLKVYDGINAEQSYEREIDAFQKLQPQSREAAPGMIRFYGSFKQLDRFNVLLEYADIGTLEQYWKQLPPPRTGEEMISFWNQMFQLIGAVKYVHHEGQSDASDEEQQLLQGWHQDIKPNNILVSSLGETVNSHYDYRMKLADLGTCHFRRSSSTDGNGMDRDSQGTNTYGAPECSRTDAFLQSGVLRVTQKVDIWSLGAVFSEAAVWATSSFSGLKSYRRARLDAPKDEGIQNTDCFHDGQKVLEVVRKTQWALVLKPDDFITKRVVPIIDSMLVQESERATVLNLWKTSQRAIKDAREEMDMMQPFDHSAGQSYSSLPSTSRSESHQDSGLQQLLDRSNTTEGSHNLHTRSYSHRFEGAEAQGHLASSDILQHRSSVPIRGPQMVGSRQTIQDASHGRNYNNPTRSNFEMQPRAHTYGAHSTQQSGSWDPQNIGPHAASGLGIRSPGKNIEGYHEPPHTPQRSASNIVHPGHQHQEQRFLEPPPQHLYPPGSSGYGGDQTIQAQETLWDQSPPSQQFDHRYTTSPENGESHSPNNWNRQGTFTDRPGISSPPPNPGKYYTPNFQPPDPLSVEGHTYHSFSPGTPLQHNTGLPPQENRSRVPEPVPIVPERKRKPPAELPITVAIKWRAKKQGKVEDLLGYRGLFDRLKSRDHVFIIDDSLSMLPHWQETEDVFGVLAYVVKSADPDGLDLYFTSSLEPYNSKKGYGIFSTSSSTKLLEYVHNRKQKIDGSTNLDYALDCILGPYINQLERAWKFGGSNVRPLNLYILTDGRWEDGCNPASAIRRIISKLKEFRYPEDSKQIGIQFITFGHNKEALARIQALDDKLDTSMDIVDATKSNDNMWKMLLGAIDKTFDNAS